MILENKGLLILIISFCLLILGNILFLDFYLIGQHKNNKIISAINPQNSPNYPEPSIDFLSLCKQEITQAIATLSSQKQSDTVSKPAVMTTSPISKKTGTVYWPLGGNIVTSQQDWSYTGGAEAFFNKNDFIAAKTITWEAFIKIKDNNGEANARLYDASNKVVISESEIRGGGDTFVLRSSIPLTLLEGNNLYQVQLRSSTGYEVYMEGARFKVEY